MNSIKFVIIRRDVRREIRADGRGTVYCTGVRTRRVRANGVCVCVVKALTAKRRVELFTPIEHSQMVCASDAAMFIRRTYTTKRNTRVSGYETTSYRYRVRRRRFFLFYICLSFSYFCYYYQLFFFFVRTLEKKVCFRSFQKRRSRSEHRSKRKRYTDNTTQWRQ